MCPLSASSPEIFLFVLLPRARPVTIHKPFGFISCLPASHTALRLSEPVSKLPVRFAVILCARLLTNQQQSNPYFFLRKEVIQPHLPIRLPCYDFTPVISPAFGGSFLSVRSPTSGITYSHGVTGGVYKTRERIHRDILIRDY